MVYSDETWEATFLYYREQADVVYTTIACNHIFPPQSHR